VGRLTDEGDIVTETAANARDGAKQSNAAKRNQPARALGRRFSGEPIIQ
jgi:hypothetical protein